MMRRALIIMALGLAGAALGYCCVYFMCTAKPRAWMRSEQPELAWLKTEFNLSSAEYERISQLHAGYLPQCMERCRRIEALNAKVSEALASSTNVTSELEQLLSERAQMRATCQAEMLNHFFAVSRTMPPEQGKRYLSWVQQNTGLQEHTMHHGQASSHASHSH